MIVSVEFAHGRLDVDNQPTDDVMRSCTVAEHLVKSLIDQGHDVWTCVLLDDKRVSPTERDQKASNFFARLEGPHVSYYCFERDLVPLAADLIALLPHGPRREKMRREIEEHVAEYASLLCSVDIAIWHLMRLGVVDDKGQCLHSFEGHPPPKADFAISILGDQDGEHEKTARKDILMRLTEGKPIDRVRCLYFPDDVTHVLTKQEVIDVCKPALKELAKWPKS